MNRLPTLCCVLALALPAFSRGAEPQPQDVKPQLYRIDEGVYRGRQPSKSEIPSLTQRGIRTVLDLRGTLDHKGWERAAVEAAGMKYIRIGLSPFFPPSTKQMDQLLAILEDPTLGPIYVHCRRGSDRSGMVIACYRIAHDHWTNEQALEEARQDGLWRIEVLMKRYIRHYRPDGTVKQAASR